MEDNNTFVEYEDYKDKEIEIGGEIGGGITLNSISELEREYEESLACTDNYKVHEAVHSDNLSIHTEEGMFVKIDLATGEHTFSEDASVDELAKALWKAVAFMCPYKPHISGCQFHEWNHDFTFAPSDCTCDEVQQLHVELDVEEPRGINKFTTDDETFFNDNNMQVVYPTIPEHSWIDDDGKQHWRMKTDDEISFDRAMKVID